MTVSVLNRLSLTWYGKANLLQVETYTLCGTPEYLAPEVIRNSGESPTPPRCLLTLMMTDISIFRAQHRCRLVGTRYPDI